MGRKKARKPETPPSGGIAVASHESLEQSRTACVQGEKLTEMLEKIGREIEMERMSKGRIPEKIWIKQQFAIGVNDVARVLERMSKKEGTESLQSQSPAEVNPRRRPGPLVHLQAVLVAVDCAPRLLTQHIPAMASSVGVPVVPVRDLGGGSLRLGELVRLKTAMAIGVKARGSRINRAMEEILLAAA